MVSAETVSAVTNARWSMQAWRTRAKLVRFVLGFRIGLGSGAWVGVGTTGGLSCCGGCTALTCSHVLAAVERGGCLPRSWIRGRSRGCCARWGCRAMRQSWRRRGRRPEASRGGAGRDGRARSRALGEQVAARGALRGSGPTEGGDSAQNAWVQGLRVWVVRTAASSTYTPVVSAPGARAASSPAVRCPRRAV